MENTQSLPNQQSTEPSVQQQADQNNSKLFIVIAISILLTGIITGSIVYFWQKSASEEKIGSMEQKVTSLEKQISTMENTVSPSQPTSPPTSFTTPTSDPTANWKIYRDEENGIEFKYPNSWYAKSLTEWTFQVFLENRPFEIIKGTEFMTSIGVHFNEVMNTTTSEKYFVEKTLDEGVNRIKALYSKESVTIVNLSIDGKKAVQISGVFGPGMLTGRHFTFTLIQMDDHLLIVELNDEDFKEVYDQILSTFEFTD